MSSPSATAIGHMSEDVDSPTCVQGYLAHKKKEKNVPPLDPTVGLCLSSYGGPRGGGGFL